MGRQLNRYVFKEMYKQNKMSKYDYSNKLNSLRLKLEPNAKLDTYIFRYKGCFYNVSPLVAIFKGIKDCKNPVTYLDRYLMESYRGYLNGNLDELLDMYNISNIITNDDNETFTGKLSYIMLVSTYLMHDNFGDGLQEYYDEVGGNIFLAHKNIVGLYLMLSEEHSYNLELCRKEVIDDILGCYIAVDASCAAVEHFKEKSGIYDVYMFTKICLQYFIEFYNIEGNTFDLLEELEKADKRFVSWLDGLCVDKLMKDFSCERVNEIRDNIHRCLPIMLNSILNTITIGVSLGRNDAKDILDATVKDLKGLQYKEISNLEKSNKYLTKELNAANKKIVKLEKYLDKNNKIDRVSDYEEEIAELKLKNKQLESKLEGANLHIGTLTSRVSSLKDEVELLNKKDGDNIDARLAEPNDSNSVISLEEMCNSLKDFNIVIVGGTDTGFKKILDYLPNTRYIDAETTANFDIPLNTDYVILCTKILSHSHTRRAEVFKHSVRGILKTTKTNPNEIIKEVYNTLCLQKEET